MSNVPTNLIPTKITGLPEYDGTSTLGYIPYVLEGRTYKVQFGQIAAVGAVPSSRVVAAGTGLAGGGDLSENRVISIAAGGVGFDQLSATGVIAGSYGSGGNVPVITVDAKGRVTDVSTTPIVVTGYVPDARLVSTGAGLLGGGSLANNLTLSVNFSSATPQALGSATAGVSTAAARGDHVHPAVNLSDTTQTQGALPLGRGGTGDALSPVAGAVVYSTGTKLALADPGNPGQVLTSDGAGEPYWSTVTGIGTVTSVAASGGATGLTFSGSPITTAGTLTLGGTLAVASGGTGATDAATARVNLGAAASGANSDITSMSGLTGGIATPDYIDFDTAAAPARATGRLWWDNSDSIQTLNLGMAGSNATLQIGEEMYFRIKASSTITEGQVVMFTGTVGNSGALTGAPATGLTKDTASYVMGVATENIANNGWGYVTQFGLVRNINTTGGAEAWVDGQILYYNPAVPGGLTKTVPTAPAAKVEVAAVVHAASNGSLFIRPIARFSLTQLNDVESAGAANLDLLQYNGTGGYWEHKSPSLISVGTATNLAGGAANRIAYQTGAGATGFIAAPTIANTFLEWSGSAFQWSSNSLGTVTSVAASGGTTGLTFSGSPITTSGTLTLGGTLAIANGGTGATTAADARTNLGLGTAAVLNAGVANGVATLDGAGTIPTSQLPAAVLGALNYQGVWNASTNTPTLTSSVGTKGYYYVVDVAGSTNLNGITDWKIGDWVVYNGTVWQKIDNTDSVTSVNGYTGAVVLSYTDVGAPSTTGIGASGTWGINVTGTAANVTGTVAVANGGTGQTSYTNGQLLIGNSTGNTLTKATLTAGSGVSITNGNGSITIAATGSGGTVTSVDVSGGTTGLTTSGGPITGSGTITLAGTLNVANGGTGTTTQFTAGSVVFAGASGVYSQDNTQLFWDNANDRLGVGTASPSAKLSVVGTAKIGEGAATNTSKLMVNTVSGVAAGIQLFQDGNESWVIENPASTTALTFANSGTERMRIAGGGDVGIGTSSPLGKLHINGNFIRIDQSGANLAFFGNAADLITGAPAGAGIRFDGTALRIASSSTEIAQFSSSGNVGIGTSSPSVKLEVNGSVRFVDSSAAGPDLLFGNVGGGTSINNVANARTYIGAYETVFTNYDNSSEWMRIDTSGNVGIGTSSPNNRLQSAYSVPAGVPAAGAGAHGLAVGSTGYGLATGAITNGNAYLQATRWDGVATNYDLLLQPNGGNVGIGTLSPSAKLHVDTGASSGTALIVGATSASASQINMGIGVVTAGRPFIGTNTNTNPLEIGTRNAIELMFLTNATERARIDTSGNLLVGKTSASVGTDGIQLLPSGYSGFSAAGTTALFLNRNTNDGTILEFGRNGVAAATMGLTSSALTFGTAGSERMRITSAGDLLVGDTTWRLSGIAAAGQAIQLGSRTFIGTNGTGDTALGGLASSNYTAVYAAGSERMRIDSSGNVGIGTSSPKANTGYATLTLNNASNGGVVQFTQADTTIGQLFFDGNGGTLRSISNTPLVFGTNNTERMRIDDNGRILLGQTANANSFRLQIMGSGGAAGDISLDSNASYGELQTFNSKPLYLNRQGNNIIMNLGGGNVGIGTSAPSLPLVVSNAGAQGLEFSPTGAVGGGPYFLSYNRTTGAYISNTSYALSHTWFSSATRAMDLDSVGRLAVGTTGPINNNMISAYGAGWNGFAAMVTNNIYSTFQGFNSSAALTFQVDGSGNGYFAGNVGIGTLSPGTKLAINDPGTGLGFTNAASGNFNIGLLAGTGSALAYLFQRANSDLIIGTNNTEQMRVTAAGNVGIGTGAPAEAVEISRVADPKIRFVDQGNIDAKVGIVGSTALGFEVNGAERARIDSSGNLLVGTTTANGILSVVGNQISVGNGSGSGSLGIQIKGTALSAIPSAQVQAYIATGDSSMGVAGDLLIAPRTDVVANIRFITGTSPAERMRIVSNGDVGIGTTDPTSILQASASSSSTGLAIAGPLPTLALYDNNGTTGTGFIAQVNTDTYVYNKESGNLLLGTTNTERMRIDGSGNVGIGATTITPIFGRTLQISNGSTEGSLSIVGSTGAGYVSTFGAVFGVTGRGGMGLGLGTNDVERMRIDTSGNVGIGTTGPVSKLEVSSGYITSGTVSSTGGPKILAGYYTSGHLATFGGEYSSGGPVIGYGVWPSTASASSFISATPITISRGAYTIEGATHKWYSGGAQAVAIDSAVSMSEVMRISASGNVGIGTNAPAVKLHVEGSGPEIRVQSTTSSDGFIRFINTSGSYSIGMSGAPSNVLLTYDRGLGQTVHNYFGGASGYHGWYTNDIERMRIDSSGNVGIGTSAPGTRLDVWTPNGTATTVRWAQTGVTNYDWRIPASTDAFTLNYGGTTERMRIDSAGNVGIGTSAPGYKLTVNGGDILVSRGSGAAAADAAINFGGNANNYIYGGNANNIMAFATNGSERVRIDSSGNIGIGTTAIAERLTVNGALQFNNTSNFIYNNGGSGGSANAGIQLHGTSLFVAFFTNATERMRIDSSGNVGIGTSSPGYKLDVSGGARATTSFYTADGQGFAWGAATSYVSGSSASNYVSFVTSNTERFRIDSTGAITSADLADAVGYKGLPQNAKTASYTLVMADQSKDIYLSGTTSGQTITIPANASVAFPVGTIIQITNDSNQNWTVAITSDTLVWSPSGTAGSRTLAAYGQATIRKVTSTRWWISGTGLT